MHCGANVETGFLGRCYKDWREERYYEENASFEKCAIRVEEGVLRSGYDPRNPRTVLARDFRNDISIYLDRPKELELYPSVGYQLDWNHGVDFFLKYKGIRTTFDLTKTRGGKEKYLADFILTLEAIRKKRYKRMLALSVAWTFELPIEQ